MQAEAAGYVVQRRVCSIYFSNGAVRNIVEILKLLGKSLLLRRVKHSHPKSGALVCGTNRRITHRKFPFVLSSSVCSVSSKDFLPSLQANIGVGQANHPSCNTSTLSTSCYLCVFIAE